MIAVFKSIFFWQLAALVTSLLEKQPDVRPTLDQVSPGQIVDTRVNYRFWRRTLYGSGKVAMRRWWRSPSSLSTAATPS